MERKEIHKEEIDNLISMYLTGNIDSQSLKTLTAWSRESAENNLYVRNRIELWFSSGVAGSTTSFDKEKAFERFKASAIFFKDTFINSIFNRFKNTYTFSKSQ